MIASSAAARCADWIEATRTAGGYGGPVAHWWRDCLIDCRSGHDWRYEGIVAGYLELHRATGETAWLDRACRAGDDLLAAQAEDGHFSRSLFEQNPGTAGTPHEAAADTALLRLALHLRHDDAEAADRYLASARRNLEHGQIRRLWDAHAGSFRDDPGRPSFVPNKACTLLEALFLLAEATQDDRWVRPYAARTADAVLRHQVRRPGHLLDGAIAQNSFGAAVVGKYFPYYVARCIPGLLETARFTGDDRYAEAALAAGRFVVRTREADGGFPQVVYADGRVNRNPRWVAAVGDILRVLDLLAPLGLVFDPGPTKAWLAAGLLPCGAVRTARGFARQGHPNGTADEPPELRDILPVVGWCDKAFRYLCTSGRHLPAPGPTADVELDCTFLGRPFVCSVGRSGVALRRGRHEVYRWTPGEPWARAEPWLVVR